MIKSMTGYGAAKAAADELEITVEVKSVNNRYLDCSVRIPRSFIFAEETIKASVTKHISRGKVDVFVSIDSSNAHDLSISVNEALASGYVQAVQRLSETYDLVSGLSALSLSRFPDVLQVQKKEMDRDAISAAVGSILEQALCEFDTMRCREGEKMREDILHQLSCVEELICLIEERSPDSVSEYKEKLQQRIQEMVEITEMIESRVLTEVAIFADKSDVNEEIVRLKSHLLQLRDMIMSSSPVGRKLDFIIQEMNREVNTIGSKCSSADITRHVVDIKAHMEKMREQVQNIE